MNKPLQTPTLFHGRVVSPPSRGSVVVDLGLLGTWQVNEMEGGKNFPSYVAGPFPEPYQTDDQSVVPPPDGFILSGGKNDERECVNFTNEEMAKKIGRDFAWPLLDVQPGHDFHVRWEYTAPHTTRGYKWFITKDGWNPKERITRDQLEPKAIYEDYYTQVPYYSHAAELQPKVEHHIKLPTDKKGHHVLVLLWVVANTGNAFYQAFDLDFK